MTKKVTWTRDGDQYVGKLGRHEARITPWVTPLSDAYCHKWGQSNVLKLAKDAVAEKLTQLQANDEDASAVNRDLTKMFCAR